MESNDTVRRADLLETAAELSVPVSASTVDDVLTETMTIGERLGSRDDGHGQPGTCSGHRSDDEYNALLFVYDQPRQRTATGRLADLTLVIKDNIAVRDLTMTCGSTNFEYVPDFDATVVDRLLDAGGVIIGKANMDAFAFGPAGQWSEFGRVINPLATDRLPGGSSSGSGAAVAAGLADAALGTDSGGSVRSPAACCGIVGMKPTHGLVPRDGLVDLMPSTDVIGPLARDVETVGTVLDVIRGPTLRDPTASHTPIGALDHGQSSQSVTFGVIENTVASADDAVADAVTSALDRVTAAGDHHIHYRELSFDGLLDAFTVIMGAEFAWLLRQGFAVRGEGTGYETGLIDALRGAELNEHIGERVLPGACLDAITDGRAYLAARSIATEFRLHVERMLEDVDVLVTPTLRSLPPEHGSMDTSREKLRYSNTKPFSLTGGPALSLPIARVDELPVSIQLIGRPFEDTTVLQAAAQFEAISTW